MAGTPRYSRTIDRIPPVASADALASETMLLHLAPGACSLAVHLLLVELGAAFDIRLLDLSRGQAKAPEFLDLNPKGAVPVLERSGGVQTETAAILVTLALEDPRRRFLAASQPALGTTLEWVAWLSSSLHVALSTAWVPVEFLPNDADPRPLQEFGWRRTLAGFDTIEARLDKWAAGPGYSIADMYLLPFYRWGNRLGLPMASQYPNWTRWARQMLGRPAVRRVFEAEGITIEGDP